jgi:hypothetical protein
MSTSDGRLIRARARELADGVYGTIVAAGVLAATAPDKDPGAFDTMLYLFATVFVLWLAHAWAHTMAARAVGLAEEHDVRHALVADRALVLSALPPMAVLTLVRLLGGDDELAIDVALGFCVALLAVAGVLVARRQRASPLRGALIVITAGGFGAFLVVLKVLVH